MARESINGQTEVSTKEILLMVFERAKGNGYMLMALLIKESSKMTLKMVMVCKNIDQVKFTRENSKKEANMKEIYMTAEKM